MKKFNFRNYENCCLSVGHYPKEKAMWICVIDSETDEEMESLTLFNQDFDYEIGLVTVYADIVEGNEIHDYKTATEVLQELGVVEKLWETIKYDDGTAKIAKADVCSIDLYKLSKYTKDWDYWEFEPDK